MNKTDELLIKHGILPGYKGFNYVKRILEKNEDMSKSKITNVYQDIAEEFDSTGIRIERDIRSLLLKSDLVNIGKGNKAKLALLQLEYADLK